MTSSRVADFKDRLKEALEKKNMRAVDLMDRTDVPKSAISFYLAGKSKPKADRLYKIAQALDISEAWLLGYDVPMARSLESKKNDQLARLVLRMRNDEDFFNSVVALDKLDEKAYQGIAQLLSAFQE